MRLSAAWMWLNIELCLMSEILSFGRRLTQHLSSTLFFILRLYPSLSDLAKLNQSSSSGTMPQPCFFLGFAKHLPSTRLLSCSAAGIWPMSLCTYPTKIVLMFQTGASSKNGRNRMIVSSPPYLNYSDWITSSSHLHPCTLHYPSCCNRLVRLVSRYWFFLWVWCRGMVYWLSGTLTSLLIPWAGCSLWDIGSIGCFENCGFVCFSGQQLLQCWLAMTLALTRRGHWRNDP